MAVRTLAVLFTVLCASQAVLATRSLEKSSSTGFLVQGKVFCDNCQAGFETPLTTYIAGAKVAVVCSERETAELTRRVEGVTDASGTFNIPVDGDHENEICESVLVSSPDAECAAPLAGRQRSRVSLTYDNGIPAYVRYSNSLGFVSRTTLSGCEQVMQAYLPTADDV